MSHFRIHFWTLSSIATVIILVILALKPDWGFYGHRTINKLAVFTLPQEMLPLFKKNITYISDHAVDPDMRRYATKHEAVRHYIDIDQWDTIPFTKIPRDFNEAILRFGDLLMVNDNGDTSKIQIDWTKTIDSLPVKIGSETIQVKKANLVNFVREELMSKYYDEEMTTDIMVFNSWIKSKRTNKRYTRIVLIDKFSDHGILPFYLEIAMNKLTYAFKAKDKNAILRNAADIGHYIGDAHVPLHTTTNYNGQFTDQLGIHAFWESRLPELFAEKEYDFFVGKAEYITDNKTYIWEIITKSHSYLKDVLAVEKKLSQTYPSDQQFCYDQRLNLTVRIQCKEYSKAYHEALFGMVEERMTSSIKAIGDIWYSCWINAGSPNLKNLNDGIFQEEKITADPNIKTREHEN